MPEEQTATKRDPIPAQGKLGASEAPQAEVPQSYAALQSAASEYGVESVTMENFSDLATATFGNELPPEIQALGEQLSAVRESTLEAGQAARGRTTEDQFSILEDALRMRGGIGAQEIGTSKIFEQAGLTGFTNLSQSLNSRLGEMHTRYEQFNNSLRSANRDTRIRNQQLIDTYQSSLDEYKLLRDEYEFDVTRFDEREARLKSMEHEFAVMDRQLKNEKELEEFKANFKESKGSGDLLTDEILSFDTKGLPDVGQSKQSSLGKGIVTAYGSYDADGKPVWEHGLDYVLEGGVEAELIAPRAGVVVGTRTGFKPRDGNGFGNQIKVKFGENEVWFSHLGDVGDFKKGDTFEAGTVLGKQGNTGKVMGPTGVHLDITMPDGKGGYYSPREVAGFIGLGEVSPYTKDSLIDLNKLFSRFSLKQDLRDQYTRLFKSGDLGIEAIEELISEKVPDDVKELKTNELNVHLSDIERGESDVQDSIRKLRETGNYNDQEIFEYFRESVSDDKKWMVWAEELSTGLLGFFNSNQLERELGAVFFDTSGGMTSLDQPVVGKALKAAGITEPDEAMRWLIRQSAQGNLKKLDIGIEVKGATADAARSFATQFNEKYPDLKRRTGQVMNQLFRDPKINFVSGLKD